MTWWGGGEQIKNMRQLCFDILITYWISVLNIRITCLHFHIKIYTFHEHSNCTFVQSWKVQWQRLSETKIWIKTEIEKKSKRNRNGRNMDDIRWAQRFIHCCIRSAHRANVLLTEYHPYSIYYCELWIVEYACISLPKCAFNAICNCMRMWF